MLPCLDTQWPNVGAAWERPSDSGDSLAWGGAASSRKTGAERSMSTTHMFLAGLPAALGIGGYVIFQISRSRGQSSPLLKMIVEMVKEKGGSMPALDGRLTARQVFSLVKDNAELRRKLDAKDYKLLETVMRREERAHFLALGSMLIALAISLAAFLYLRSLTPRIVSATIAAAPAAGATDASTVANTFDDLKVTWASTGGDGSSVLRLVNTATPSLSVDHPVRVSDHVARLEATTLRRLWPDPELGAPTAIRIEFLGEGETTPFGPFDVQTALEIMYFVQGTKVTVAAMNGQNKMVSHSFASKCVAWPEKVVQGEASPQSVSLAAENGTASANFASDFQPDPVSLKCAYLGPYPHQLVRYRNLHLASRA